MQQQLRYFHVTTGFIISIESKTAQKTTHGTDVHAAIMTLSICMTLTPSRVHVRPHLLLGVRGELTLVFADTHSVTFDHSPKIVKIISVYSFCLSLLDGRVQSPLSVIALHFMMGLRTTKYSIGIGRFFYAYVFTKFYV